MEGQNKPLQIKATCTNGLLIKTGNYEFNECLTGMTSIAAGMHGCIYTKPAELVGRIGAIGRMK